MAWQPVFPVLHLMATDDAQTPGEGVCQDVTAMLKQIAAQVIDPEEVRMRHLISHFGKHVLLHRHPSSRVAENVRTCCSKQ